MANMTMKVKSTVLSWFLSVLVADLCVEGGVPMAAGNGCEGSLWLLAAGGVPGWGVEAWPGRVFLRIRSRWLRLMTIEVSWAGFCSSQNLSVMSHCSGESTGLLASTILQADRKALVRVITGVDIKNEVPKVLGWKSEAYPEIREQLSPLWGIWGGKRGLYCGAEWLKVRTQKVWCPCLIDR